MKRLLLILLLTLPLPAQTLNGVHFVNDTGTMQSSGTTLAMGGTNLVCTYTSGPSDNCGGQTVVWSTPTACVTSVTGGTIAWNPSCHPNDHTRFIVGSFAVWAILHVVVNGTFSDTAQAIIQDSYPATNCDLSVANVVTLTASSSWVPGPGLRSGLPLAFQGFTACALLNGQHLTTQAGTSATQIVVNFTHTAGSSTPETTGYVSDLWTQYTTPDLGWYVNFPGGFYNPSVQPGTVWTMGVGFTQDGGGSGANPFPFCNWTSSNTAIATVNRYGIVTGVGNGSYTISCNAIGQAVIDNTIASFTGDSLTTTVSTPTIGSLQTWYVRPDGGTPWVNGTQTPLGQCKGLTNAAYPGLTVQRWLPNTVITPGTIIIDTVGNYESTVSGGTTGNSGQPSWSSGTTTDNTVTWTKGATYPVGQACAMGNLRYLWTDEVTTGQTQWMIAPGDSVSVAPVGGNGYYNLGNDWQATVVGGTNGAGPINCNGGNDCYMPTIPSGNAAHHTKIYGSLCPTGCGTTNNFGVLSNVGAVPVPDRTKLTVVAGTWDQLFAINLLDSQYVDITGFRVISPAGCGYANPNFGPYQCNPGSSTVTGNFGKTGIRESAFTSFDNLTDIEIDNMGGDDIQGATGGTSADGTNNYIWTRVLVQGGGTVDMDDLAHFSDISVSGGLKMEGGGFTFSGCVAGPWPWTLNYPWQRCVDQILGGLGDGIGTGSTTGTFAFDHVIALLNEQDGIDLLHSGAQQITITNSIAVGNIGNGFKLGPSHNTTLSNSFSQTNCARVLQPYGDQPATLAAGTPGVCRSGEPLAITFDTYGTYAINSNTFSTYAGGFYELLPQTSYDVLSIPNLSFVDNYFVGSFNNGYSTQNPDGSIPTYLNFSARSNNVWIAAFPCPSPLSANETCSNSYSTGQQAVDPPSLIQLGTTEPLFDATNATLNPSGSLAGTGVTYAGQQTVDMNGVANPSPPNIGAYNLSGTPPPPPAFNRTLRGHTVRRGSSTSH